MNLIIADAVGLLVIAVVVALAARRLKLPYTVGLVVTGIGLAFTNLGSRTGLTHDFIFDVILPPLLFEAAINIRWKELRQDAIPVLTLAIVGTALAAACVTAGMVFILGWPVPSALLFGVLIAATDPVAVIAMFKDNRIGGRLRLLVESESLFNDGVAAVLFALALAWSDASAGASVTMIGAGQTLLILAGGGIFTGVVTGLAATLVASRTSDRLIESTLTTVTAYGAFLLAERFQFSGVLAAVAAGLVTGNMGVFADGAQSEAAKASREFVLSLWDFAAFIANSLVFLLIGLTVAVIPFRQLGAKALLITIALTLLSRALTVYPLSLLFSHSKMCIPISMQHVLWWGGLRGALALALALSLPGSLALRDEIFIAAFGVVVFSVIVQGVSMPWILRRLSLT
jgi:CPA1 family monovalent cation:H+ antiporter